MMAWLSCACTAMPPLDQAQSVLLIADTSPATSPRASITGESDLGPGSAAMDGLEVAAGCDFLLPLCAIVTVPLAAIVGATAKSTQKLPQQQAIELNQVSVSVGASMNLRSQFREALFAEAEDLGIPLVLIDPEASVHIETSRIYWDIGAGNRVGLRVDIRARVQIDGRTRTRNFTYRGDRAQVDAWIADEGKAIRESLDAAIRDASKLVWSRLLG